MRCVGADVGGNDRVWTLWEITTGELAGTTFFGSSYGMPTAEKKKSDPKKADKAMGMFKQALLAFGITDVYAKSAATMQDIAGAIVGVEGKAVVKLRTYRDKDSNEVQSNDVSKFKLTARPALPGVGATAGVPVPKQTPPPAPPAAGAPVPQLPPLASAPAAQAAEADPLYAAIVASEATAQDNVVADLEAQLAAAKAAQAPAAGVPGTQDGPPAPVAPPTVTQTPQTPAPAPVAPTITVDKPAF